MNYMKIRNKLILTIIFAFTLNSVLLFGYYELFLSKSLESRIDSMQLELDYIAKDMCNNIEKQSNLNYANEFIDNSDEINNDNKYYIQIKNLEDETLIERGKKIRGALTMTSLDIINIDDEAYILTIIQSLPINDVKQIPVYGPIVKAEIIIIGIILIFSMAIIYIKIIYPIQSLQNDIENYKYGIKPAKCKMHDEIGWLKNKFVELTEKLDKEKENQNRIIASISHDIKTPLTSIMGYSERLQNKLLPEERQKKYIEIMYSKSQDIKELIDEFDDYLSYNLESSLKKEKMKVKKLVNLIREEYEDELNQLNIDFTIKSKCDNCIVDIDLSKIRRVFGNAIGNSIKNMTSNKKEIKIYFDKIDDNIQVSIRDNGIGVDESELDKIFEALYTSDKSRVVAGLGLSICKSAIEGHGGEIWAENNCNGGLTVKFTLKNITK